MLLDNSISLTWKPFLNTDILKNLQEIENKIGTNYTPKKENVMKFMKNDLNKVKVCIIGQDPYFSVSEGRLVANGRAFQPDNLENWNQSFRQVSLKNIIRLVHKSNFNISDYSEIKTYKEILKEINSGTFNLKQPKDWFDSLENQGVLFLNRYLTTEIGKANAHRNIWNNFVLEVIKYLDYSNPNIIWFLWGNEAILCENFIKNGTVFKSRHPMMCSFSYNDDFLKSDCFKNTSNVINWLG